MKKMSLIIPIIFSLLFVTCKSGNLKHVPDFMIPFTKNSQLNPVLTPIATSEFYCPVRKDIVNWEEKDVFNPASVVKDDTLFLLYRAEDSVGRHNGTSRIGMAYSFDGYSFIRQDKPVFFPSEEEFLKYEWEGGCEDPRIIEDENGTYYMTYTAYDGDIARLLIATSTDLRKWTKYGSIFENAGEDYVNLWSKSGSIVCREENGRLIAIKINGVYWMYWGDTNIYIATSENLIDWTPLLENDPGSMQQGSEGSVVNELKILFNPRDGMFDSDLVEPGPPAIMTQQGILFIYNSRNKSSNGDKNLAAGTYSAGQIIVDEDDPTNVLYRTDKYFITPDQHFEITGQVNNVCFVEGLSFYRNKWFLYYGTADSKIAVAESDWKK